MSHFKLRYNTLPGLVIAVCILLLPITSFAHITVDCNDSFVTPHPTQLIIDVLPTGTDDTENIQCALNAAAQKGVPVVRLAKGDFAISNILVKNFKGSFQGTSRADTHLTILDNSINCATMHSQGLMSAAVKFSGGEPKLKFMSIHSDQPCMLATTMRAIVHFTGENSRDASCKNDVIFASVDRVDMLGPGRRIDLSQAAIQASPEGLFMFDSCKTTLLGTLKLNQSTITGYEIGLLSSMKSSAQVDINFNSFTDNRLAVSLLDTYQSTTITGNTFTSENDDENISQLSAIKLHTQRDSAPDKTRLLVHNNNFIFSDVEEPATNYHRGNVFDIKFGDKVQNVSLALTDNQFQINAAHFFVIDIREIDNWVVSGNIFRGTVGTGIVAEAFIEPSMSGCVIVANQFTNLTPNISDVYLGESTTKCIVGPDQNATVRDFGVANTIL